MSVPASNWNVMTSVAVESSANCGLPTLREKTPLTENDTAPMTSPSELKAARVPSCTGTLLISTVHDRLAVVSPGLILSSQSCNGGNGGGGGGDGRGGEGDAAAGGGDGDLACRQPLEPVISYE